MADVPRDLHRIIQAVIETSNDRSGILALDHYRLIYDVNAYRDKHELCPDSEYYHENEFAADLRQKHAPRPYGDDAACSLLPIVLDQFQVSDDEAEDPSVSERERALSCITLPSLPSLIDDADDENTYPSQARAPEAARGPRDSGYSTVDAGKELTAPKYSPPSSTLANPGEETYTPRHAVTDETRPAQQHTAAPRVLPQTSAKIPVEIKYGAMDKRTLMMDATATKATLISEIYKQGLCPEQTERYTDTVITVMDTKTRQPLRNRDAISRTTRVEFLFK